jgi:hypothetical protein
VKKIPMLLLAGGLAVPVLAQQIKLNLDHLAAKASDSVDLSLNGGTLQFAAKFLNDNDADEGKAKKLLAGLEGIYVRSYEFKKDGEWTQADAEAVRNQLKAPQWSRMVGFKKTEDNESAEVYIRTENKKVTGITILTTEPREFTVVNIAGSIDIDNLADLGGHFGVPKLNPPQRKGDKKED